MDHDDEANRFSARARRYANLGVNAGALAARVGARRLMGGEPASDARALTEALGTLKGPMMKVAQMLATIPDALPADYANELISLQTQAPPMGAAFVRRRMQAELGPDWRERFAEFDFDARRRRLARPGASRRQPRGRRRSPASCNIPTWPRRWRSISRSSI